MNNQAIIAATKCIRDLAQNGETFGPEMAKNSLCEVLHALKAKTIYSVDIAEDINPVAATAALGRCIQYIAEGKNARALSMIEECMHYLRCRVCIPCSFA